MENLESTNQPTKKRELTVSEITETANNLGIDALYLEQAKMVERSDGSSKLELFTNNFFSNFFSGEGETEKFLAKKIERANLNSSKEDLEKAEYSLNIWKQFQTSNKELVERLEDYNLRINTLVQEMLGYLNKQDASKGEEVKEKIDMLHSEISNELEQAYIYFAKQKVDRTILRA